jgi:hypothetical protein
MNNMAFKGVKRSCHKLIKKEQQQVNGTGFSDPTVFYNLWAYNKNEVKGVTLKQERTANTKLKKDVNSVLMESSTQLGKK